MRVLVTVFTCLALGAMAKPEIEHVVLLLMENRPFDHFYGFAEKELPGINGLTDDVCMWVDPFDESKGQECVENGGANYVCQSSGTMDYTSMVKEIFGANTSWDGFEPICPGGLPQPDFCANGDYGTEKVGTSCVFPFIYDGEEQTSCVSSPNYGGQGWCSTTSDFDTDGKWGGCGYCESGYMCTNGVGTEPVGTACAATWNYDDEVLFVWIAWFDIQTSRTARRPRVSNRTCQNIPPSLPS